MFTGRKKEIESLLKWIDGIKREVSKSTAILSRRKTGKSALMQRLYNLTFHENDNVVPFYFEIKEANQWLGDFAENFFLAFIYQYLAFKTRKPEKEAKAFQEKARALMTLEDVRKPVFFVFSAGGFHKNTLAYLKKEQIAWSDDSRWLED